MNLSDLGGRYGAASVPPPDGKVFLEMQMRNADGTAMMLRLDRQSAWGLWVEMETWGDDCGQDAKDLRARLRDHFNF